MTEDLPRNSRQALSAHAIFVRYVAFAVVSSVCNLASQELIIRAIPFAPLMVSVLTGTGVGFVVKYILEKKWVFLDDYDSHAAEIRKVLTYGVFGIGTTIFFWGVELSFWQMWHTETAKYIGGALGLALGNWIKYMLDRQFVFRRAAA